MASNDTAVVKYGENANVRSINRYISETIEDRHIAYGLLIGIYQFQ